MRVLVTGAGGWLGGWVRDELDAAGHEVLGDPLRPSTPFDEAELVVHLDALVSIDACEANPPAAIQRNVTGTWQVANRCRELGLPLVFGSSIGVRAPASLYELTKAMGEAICMQALPPSSVRMARIAFPYGPGSPPARNLVTRLLVEIATTGRAEVWGDTYRPWLYVGDAAKALVAVVDHFDALPVVIDVGQSFRVPSVKETAEACVPALRGVGFKSAAVEVVELERSVRRPAAVYPDPGALLEVGWAPKTRLEQGLARVARWLVDEGTLRPPSVG